jgi:hypothetical protein
MSAVLVQGGQGCGTRLSTCACLACSEGRSRVFTAGTLRHGSHCHPQEQEAWRLNPQSLEDFVTLWSEYDDGSGSIDPRDLEALLLR